MDRMGSYGHQGVPEVPLASSRICCGLIGTRLIYRLPDKGLKGFRPLCMKGVSIALDCSVISFPESLARNLDDENLPGWLQLSLGYWGECEVYFRSPPGTIGSCVSRKSLYFCDDTACTCLSIFQRGTH